MSLQKVLLCPFHCKTRSSAVSLETPGIDNIPQVPGNRAEVGQNHDARKAVLATLSVLKWLANIPQLPVNEAKVAENRAARNAVSATP